VAARADGRRPEAFESATRMLALRPHFRAELEKKLIQKGHERDTVDQALSRLDRLGYLNDAALARSEAERLRRTRRLGPAAVAAALGRKGAPQAAIEEALADQDAESGLELALAAARSWLARHPADPAALARHLHRKGHPRRVIFRVLNDLLPGDEAPPEAD